VLAIKLDAGLEAAALALEIDDPPGRCRRDDVVRRCTQRVAEQTASSKRATVTPRPATPEPANAIRVLRRLGREFVVDVLSHLIHEVVHPAPSASLTDSCGRVDRYERPH